MCDQEVESCGCVDEECTGARVQDGVADTAGVDCWNGLQSASSQILAKVIELLALEPSFADLRINASKRFLTSAEANPHQKRCQNSYQYVR